MRQSEKNNTCKTIKKKLERPNPSAEETLHNVLVPRRPWANCHVLIVC